MSSPAQYFRAGVGAVVVNSSGLVLALERADIPDAWQLPQGGLENGEEPLQAAFREIAEETGITQTDLELLDAYPEPLVYELPANARSEKTGRGQVQYWFLFGFHGSDDAVDVRSGAEFRAWKWMSFQSLLHTAADFRQPVYRKLADRFRPHVS
jgi:putative (di)nucleoside polyphosphate hydrolase